MRLLLSISGFLFVSFHYRRSDNDVFSRTGLRNRLRSVPEPFKTEQTKRARGQLVFSYVVYCWHIAARSGSQTVIVWLLNPAYHFFSLFF